MFHAKHADRKDPGNIVVRGNDTDIAVILTCNSDKLVDGHLWYDFGVDYNNNRAYVDIIKLAQNMENVKALPGVCAFTGNDYSPAF